MAMIAAVELNDLVPPGKSASETNARHRRFGSAVDHSNFFNRRHPFADQIGHFDFEWIWNSKTQSARGCVAHRIDNYSWCVTKNRRTPAADVIDVFLSIDIPNFRFGRAFNKKWFAANIAKRAHGRIDATGNTILRASEQLRRTRSHAPKIIINSLNR